MNDETLRARARELGVQTEYHDVAGTLHHAVPEALDAVVAVLDADRAGASVTALTAPVHVGGPVRIAGRIRSASVEVDGAPVDVEVRRGDDGDELVFPADVPFGCHTVEFDSDQGPGETVLVVAPPTMPRDPALAGTGGLFVPTYAMWEQDRPLPSFGHLHELARAAHAAGLSVVSTLPLYATSLDDPFDPSPYSPISRLHWNEVYLDDDGLPPAPVPESGAHVDWRALAARRRAQLVEMAGRLGTAEQDRLTAFLSAHPDVGAYARFRARHESGGGDPDVIEQSHVLAQYLADQQLAAIAADPQAAALALDLPIGSSPAGYEVWADPTMFADAVAVGAPPDSFFAEGQNWGFPPPLPAAMHATGHRLWRQLIARVGRFADMLRIDHAMAIERLWWVPDGFSADRGVYVHYPREELLAVIAASAAAAGVTIVGEDLGTVPEEVMDAFDRWDVLGMYEEQFNLGTDPLPHIPARTVAGIRTHDMEPISALVGSEDTSGYRERLARAHGRPVEDRWDRVVDEMLVRLAASDSYLVIADLDDLIGETEPHNLPGRVVEGLWGRRLHRPTSEVLADPAVRQRLDVLARGPR